MTISLSNKIRQLRPSPSIAAKQRVNELQAQGRRVLDFCLGEPDFDTPAHIIEAAISAMCSGDTHYTGSQGIPALRRAIADKLRQQNGAEYDPSEIVVGIGAKQLIFEVFAASLSEGDEVIIPAPCWVSYPDIVKVNGGTPVILPCTAETGFKLSAPALEAAITPRTRWLVINSPSNPTGAVYTRDEWLALAEVLERHPDVALMTDEIYELVSYDGIRNLTPVAVAPALRERCVIINGLSKAYAMTGWRVGYAAGPAPLIAAVTKLLGQSTTCACAFAQTAAVAALTGPQDPVAEMNAIYAERRALLVEGLNALPGVTCTAPDAAFYVFPDVSALIGARTPEGGVIASDLDLVGYLLEAASVAVMDGTSYGSPGFLRLSFATDTDTIREGLSAMRRALSALSLKETA
ncbi:pyridoxal phosphate-dependent aminotransferase [Pseudooceanicola sp. CBS1P-1]|uniref:Aminotransferase n=1 Tax=Pseudooceanicola albus TaxID=2692189 RepID=A0A6L7G7M0_9RHOB|nr:MULTISPECIES: pyridoxal phosphate-dependent aminotransferase [Pseudooceanicola]MBT9386179.1 pyridoxal phosphate-dependent aminotransferase [Pseudooceanicola endophyticus]MXN19406.1 aminotransferase class I/II-fold pyridoxal phosphate-dependent enzyme [Pseudooceanicola albus]